MPLKLFTSIPQNIREWGQWASQVPIEPSPDSVDESALADNGVTNAKLRDSAGASVIGRSAGGTGDPADIVATSDGEYLRRSGGVLGFGAIAEGDVPASIARDTEVTAAFAAHALEADPHPVYVTAAEGNAAYAPISHTHVEADITDLGNYPELDQAETISGIWEFTGDIGFFGVTAVSQQTTPSSLSLATVSGSGDDTNINNNFSALQTAVNALKTALDNLGLTG